MAPPPAQDRYGRSSRHHNERDFDRFSPQRRRPTRRERLEMDLEQFEDDSASSNSYDNEPMHRPPPHRYPRDYPPLPPPGNMWEWESGYSIHLPLKRRLEYHFPPPFFFLFLNSNLARKRYVAWNAQRPVLRMSSFLSMTVGLGVWFLPLDFLCIVFRFGAEAIIAWKAQQPV